MSNRRNSLTINGINGINGINAVDAAAARRCKLAETAKNACAIERCINLAGHHRGDRLLAAVLMAAKAGGQR